MSKPCHRAAWIVLVLVLHLVPALYHGWRLSPAPDKKFIVSVPRPEKADQEPLFHSEFVDPGFSQPSVHVSSICELPGGRVAASWYGGTREGAQDVAIYFATRGPGLAGEWSLPRPIVSRETAQQELFKYVKKVGNGVLVSKPEGTLYLVYVSIGFGGWSGSSLNIKKSTDQGATWTRSKSLPLTPFFNVSSLVKNSPAFLTGGGVVFPNYHELIGKFPEMLWVEETSGGFKGVKTRVAGGQAVFQPTLVPLSSHEGLMLCRAYGEVRKIHMTRTRDSGRTWSDLEVLDLPNSNSGLDAKRLADGSVLLAFNDSSEGREKLSLAVSHDGGGTWKRTAVLEHEVGKGFAYPYVLQTSDGLIHVTYTWDRKGIKHVFFNPEWLKQQEAKGHP